MKAIMAGGEKALVEIVNATHSGMTVESFTAEVHDWIAKAKHPTSGPLYTAMVFQTMLERLDYMPAHDLEVNSVPGGGGDLLRAFNGEADEGPPQQAKGKL